MKRTFVKALSAVLVVSSVMGASAARAETPQFIKSLGKGTMIVGGTVLTLAAVNALLNRNAQAQPQSGGQPPQYPPQYGPPMPGNAVPHPAGAGLPELDYDTQAELENLGNVVKGLRSQAATLSASAVSAESRAKMRGGNNATLNAEARKTAQASRACQNEAVSAAGNFIEAVDSLSRAVALPRWSVEYAQLLRQVGPTARSNILSDADRDVAASLATNTPEFAKAATACQMASGDSESTQLRGGRHGAAS